MSTTTCHLYFYADYTVLYSSANSIQSAIDNLQLSFNTLQHALLNLKLVLNADKTKVMFFSLELRKLTEVFRAAL